jgi:hypothetical protein
MAKRRKQRRKPTGGVYIAGVGSLSERKIMGCRKELSRCLEKGRSTPGLAAKVCQRRHVKCLAVAIEPAPYLTGRVRLR